MMEPSLRFPPTQSVRKHAHPHFLSLAPQRRWLTIWAAIYAGGSGGSMLVRRERQSLWLETQGSQDFGAFLE